MLEVQNHREDMHSEAESACKLVKGEADQIAQCGWATFAKDIQVEPGSREARLLVNANIIHLTWAAENLVQTLLPLDSAMKGSHMTHMQPYAPVGAHRGCQEVGQTGPAFCRSRQNFGMYLPRENSGAYSLHCAADLPNG